MPCVQAAAQKANDEHIRKNRRDLNEFDGITDPVEALKIVHRPRKYDPLLNWIPHPKPVDQLYGDLSDRDQSRLADYAKSQIGSNRNDEAEDILLCLAAFTDARFDSCLRTFASHDLFWPSLPFYRSPPDVRDELIARVEMDGQNVHHVLLALAWIGDAAVVEVFERWRRAPPRWKDSLYIAPQDYSREAGWELDDEGRRRDLYFHRCTKLVKGSSSSPDTFKVNTEREDACPWCDAKLTNLFDIASSTFEIWNGSDRAAHVQVATCEFCTAFETIFSVIDEHGHAQWAPTNSRPEDLPDDAGTWGRLPTDSLSPAGDRPPLFAAHQYLPTTFSQLGGHPTWIQDAVYPHCPTCAKTMMFLAQMDREDIEDSEGIYYAFVCPPCRTTATSYQQT